MDTKLGKKNVAFSIFFRVIILFGSLVLKRFFIRYIGNEINGLDSLYSSIIGFLSVAELGIGTAITFCMYKPIVEGDKEGTAALYCLIKRVYCVIGAIVFCAGLLVTPFLRYFVKDSETVHVNLYIPFLLMLISVVLTYFFSAKISLINAYKNNYITTTIHSLGLILQLVAQIIVVVLFKSFLWYLVCRIVAVLFQWGLTELVSYKKHSDIIKIKAPKLENTARTKVTQSIKAMFMHKTGGILANTVDDIIISVFIGVAVLGKYSNYVIIMTAMTGIITLFFTPLTAVIGHMCVENQQEATKYHSFFHTFNFTIGIVFFLGYYAIIDDLIVLMFGSDLELAKSISFVITVNHFVQFMRRATLLFRDATGTFYHDRWKPICEGVLNLILSILCVNLFGVVGVIIATIITNLLICHIVEPHVLFKYGFQPEKRKHNTRIYYIQNYLYIAVFIFTLVVLHFTMIVSDNRWVQLLSNGLIAVGLAAVPCLLAILINKNFRYYVCRFVKKKRKIIE